MRGQVWYGNDAKVESCAARQGRVRFGGVRLGIVMSGEDARARYGLAGLGKAL